MSRACRALVLEGCGLEQHERELARLCEREPSEDADAKPCPGQPRADHGDEDRLEDDRRRQVCEHEGCVLDRDGGLEEHTDGREEDAEQDAAQRHDLREELMGVE